MRYAIRSCLLFIIMPIAACSGHDDIHLCPVDQILQAADAPCTCEGVTIESGDIVGECYCRSNGSGFGCPEQDECQLEDVSSLQDILTHLPEWGWEGPYTSAVLPITLDQEASGELLLDADQVAVPADCQARDDCRHVVRFYMPAQVGQVSLQGEDDPEHAWWGFKPQLLVQAGGLFRLRPVMYDTHPEGYNFMPLLKVLPACATPCAQEELRCPNDLVCYTSGRLYCNRCDALGNERCACETAEGTSPDGTQCEFFVSGDMIMVGTCQDGICQVN